ncbi:MAG: DUF4118 domain-containing protein [Elusimicrobia bacterium]|nr:DUF4118 domain-containing protein [Elusimicrobiota bacterium]
MSNLPAVEVAPRHGGGASMNKLLEVRPGGIVPPFLIEYGIATMAVGICTAVCFAMFPFFELTNLVMVYLLGVLAVAARGRRGPAVAASVLSVLGFDFFFVPPRFTLTVADVQYVWTFLVMFVVAMLINHLTIRLRSEAEAARVGQRRTALMHAFTQQLAGARGTDQVLKIAVDHVAKVFQGAAVALLPGATGPLDVNAVSGGPAELGDKERGVAQWVYERGQPAGAGTPSLPTGDALYVPLLGDKVAVGVLMVLPRTPALLLGDQRHLLDSFAHQIGLALEVDRLGESARKAEMEAETERLRSGLLSSVSHDFRTPLAAILGSAGALLEREGLRSDGPVRELLENIQAESERLSRLVQNLLEATRLESGAVRIQKELYPLEEVVGSALERLEKALGGREVLVDIPEDLPPVPMDGTMVEQVFVNLLENAARHAPSGPIEVSAKAEGGAVLIAVADRGPGLKEEDRERVFEKFYRGKASPGAGLGLAICRAVVNAHGGRIWAESRTGGGAAFRFTLPWPDPTQVGAQ